LIHSLEIAFMIQWLWFIWHTKKMPIFQKKIRIKDCWSFAEPALKNRSLFITIPIITVLVLALLAITVVLYLILQRQSKRKESCGSELDHLRASGIHPLHVDEEVKDTTHEYLALEDTNHEYLGLKKREAPKESEYQELEAAYECIEPCVEVVATN